MEKIVLEKIDKKNNTLSYNFFITDGLLNYFSDNPFVINYQEAMINVPDAVAAIPFVCNVLPIIWLTDSELIIQELDQSFFECIDDIKKGYETIFPESTFAGKITVKKIVACSVMDENKSAAFYSGGLDSVQTLISHLDEKPDLIAIWGSDIRYDNNEGWKLVYNAIKETSEKFNLPNVAIHSTFREFDNETELDYKFHEQLKDGWWHGVKHGIGILGHAAPYVYLHNISTLYIASSNCPSDGIVRCASNPLIDNFVRFSGCKVVHDGFEFSRQDKVHNIVNFCHKTQKNITLHVCWQSQRGSNCCRCEKCYRTMAGLLAEGENPESYGFEHSDITIKNMQQYIVQENISKEILSRQWTYIYKRVHTNKRFLKKKSYWKYFRWILHADFEHPENMKLPFLYRVRRKLSQFTFYQKLYEWKEKCKV